MLSEKPWNWDRLIRVMIAILFFVSVFFLAFSAAHHYAGKTWFREGSLLYVTLGSLAFHGSILLGVGIILGTDHVTWSEAFGFASGRKIRAILLGTAATLVFLPVGMTLQDMSLRLMDNLHIKGPVEPSIMEFQNADSTLTQCYLIFWAVVMAPIAEEIFFRGILYPTVKQFGFPRLAVWGVSILFGAIHGTPAIFVPLVLLSVLFIWLYENTGTLLAPITAHSMFNAINILLMYFGEAIYETFQHLFHHGK